MHKEMTMAQYTPVYGTITSITPMQSADGSQSCTLQFYMMTQDIGPVTFIVTPETYVEDQETLKPGDSIVVFYDNSVPVPLIYPPRYQAVLIAEADDGTFAAFDYFDENLVNTDMTLKLNLPEACGTRLLMANGQLYYGNPAGHYLLVLYTTTTRSIPAMTTPEKVVVFCSSTE